MTSILRRKYTISTHTPLTGRDETGTDTAWKPLYFYSHAPYGTWQDDSRTVQIYAEFLLTRPLRDVTIVLLGMLIFNAISTHTPLTGRDGILCRTLFTISQFLLTRPLRDVTYGSPSPESLPEFLLTRPLRDVTLCNCDRSCSAQFLLTRPLRDVT